MKKRALSLVLCLLMLLAVFPAATSALSQSDLVGIWIMTKASNRGYTFTAQKLNIKWGLGLFADGSAINVMDDSTSSMNWTLSGSNVVLKIGNKQAFKFKYDSKKKTLSVKLDSSTFYFEKAPMITSDPQDAKVNYGKKVTFRVKATGTDIKCQWQYKKPDSDKWVNIKKATKSTYTLTAKEKQNGYAYRCRVKNKIDTIYSESATLTVIVTPPSVTTQPADKKVVVGSKATFKVTAAGDALKYQWQVLKPGAEEWVDVKKATKASYSLTTKASHNGYKYRCVIKNSLGTVYTEEATLTVITVPEITAEPKEASAAAGGKVSFAVKAKGKDLKYQWYCRAPESETWKKVSAKTAKTATTATLKLKAKAAMNGYEYRCEIKNKYGTVYTEPVMLLVD